MAKETVYNNTLVSGAADETLTYTRYVKDESSGKSTKELLDEKVNKTDQLGTTQIADKSVTTEKLENESVTTDKLDAASVTTEKVADANITTSKLADSSVETEKINNKAVTTDKLNDGAVDNSKLSPNAVTSEKIKDESIITEKLNDRAVTTEKVEEKAITNAKLGDQSVDGRVVREASLESKHFSNESVTTEKVARKSITKDKLADNAVDASQVVDGSIDNAKLSPDSVTTEKIKDGSVTNEKIADNTLGIGKLDPELRKTIQAATGLPEDLTQMIQDIDQSVKQLHEKDTDLQSQIDDKQQQITANDEDISLLQTRSTQMEETIKSIAATGGASQATAVTYNNEKSKLTAVNIQSAVDEVVDKTTIKDEEGNVQDTPFRVIENEEFIMAVVDSEDRLLFGIFRATGKPYFPLNEMYHVEQNEEFLWVILDAANHPLLGIQQDGTCWAAKAQWLDDIKAIKEALKTFQPKEDGKGLINLDVADSFFYISNDEYIIAVVDAENRILAGIKYDGEPYFPNHEMYSVITNEEWLYAIIDAENKFLGGFRADDGHMFVGGIDISTFISDAIIDISDIRERTAHLSTIVNDEYLSVETDAEGKVIGYIASDGSHYLYKVKSETIPEEFSHIEDPEGRLEIKTDAEGKLLQYRDKKGTLHEESLSLNHLELSNKGTKDFMEAIIQNGFTGGCGNWSNANNLQIPIPRRAYINITNSDNTAVWPQTKTDNYHYFIEFYDMQGNYFRKKIIFNAQGNSSMAMPKKNAAIDICNDDWIGDDTFSLKFGDWVSQDSFHLKAYYTDFFRGVGAVAYEFYLKQIEQLGIFNNRSFKENYTKMFTKEDSHGLKTEETSLLINSEQSARCFPGGFPAIVFLNGEFYGIYSFQLKKHRDNYRMNKSNSKHIHLDGMLSRNTIFGGSVAWDGIGDDGFEIRNPKKLYCMDGSKYDADTNHHELIDATSNSYDENNKDHIATAHVKASIIELSKYLSELEKMESENVSSDVIRTALEKHFNVTYCIEYLLFCNFLGDADGFDKNWQITTWDGIKWSVNPYDLDCLFGGNFRGVSTGSYRPWILGNNDRELMRWIYKYYKNEISQRYKELRDSGLYSSEMICSMINSWMQRIGYDNYVKEYAKWNESPCNRASFINEEYWELSSDATESYSPDKSYIAGDKVLYGKDVMYSFSCIKECQGQPPISRFYTSYPYELGCYDNLYRVKNWMDRQISFLDKELQYNN